MTLTNTQNSYALAWLKNSWYALALSGFYSITLVLLRTPWIADLIGNHDLFKAALVVHVDLSVLVWMVSITGMIWCYGRTHKISSSFAKIAFIGTLIMSISPFTGERVAIMNNYIPMLDNLFFVIGLSVFSTSVLLFAALTFVCSFYDLKDKELNHSKTLGIVKLSSSGIFILSWILCTLSFISLDKFFDISDFGIEMYYELLYWSGGHIIQFLYTQILMFSWMVLFGICINKKLDSINLYNFLLLLNFIFAIFGIYGHIKYHVMEPEFKEFYTFHMRYFGGVCPSLLLFGLFAELVISKTQKETPKFVKAAIISSVLLFLFGGVIAMMISSSNVTIPAHYHGSIVGITLAFMGIVYVFLAPYKIDDSICCAASIFYNNKREKLPNEVDLLSKYGHRQIYILMIGQILHISGLALAGGYGVMRKTAGSEMPNDAKVYMAMVGGGGLIAIIGGLMFVYICGKMISHYRNLPTSS